MALIQSFNSNSIVIQVNQGFKLNFTVIWRLWIIKDVKDVKDRSKTPVMQCMSKTIYIVIQTEYRVCDMSKMLEMSFSFSFNVMVSMLKMSKIDQIHLRAVMLCMSMMSKMGKEHIFVQGVWYVKDVRDVILIFSECNAIYVKDVKDVKDRSKTPVMQCLSKTLKMPKEHTHIFLLITSLIFNGFSIQKKFWKAET